MPDYGDKDLLDAISALDIPTVRLAAAGEPVWLTGLADWLRDAGLYVVEYAGWETRARSSGGYSGLPLCVMWHHTASPASWDGQRDANYIAIDDEDAPLANLYIERSGAVYVIAAGATNTNGKGQSLSFSRGTVPTDSMNQYAVGIEMGNDGVGESWPVEQIDAAFTVSNVVNAKLGNQPTDLATHNFYAPDRKIDPATADAVSGAWQPWSCNGSGSWDVQAVRQEASRRASEAPVGPPNGSDSEGGPVARQLVRNGPESDWDAFVCFEGGKYWLPTNEAIAQAVKDFGYDPIYVEPQWLQAAGPVVGPNPTSDPYGIRET